MAVQITRIPADRDTLIEAGWRVDENEIRVYSADPLGLDVKPHLVVSTSPAPEASLMVVATLEDLTLLSPAHVLFADFGEHDVDAVLASLGFEDVTAQAETLAERFDALIAAIIGDDTSKEA